MTSTAAMELYFANGNTGQNFVASVISASPSQTAMVINCPDGTESSGCGYYDLSLTVGPWAQATPPAGQAAGNFDMAMTQDTDGDSAAYTYSLHCDVTSHVLNVCTEINNGGDNATPTQTFTVTASGTANDYNLALASISVTAGYDKILAIASTSTAAATKAFSSSGTASTSSASNSANSVSTSVSSVASSVSSVSSAVTSMTSSATITSKASTTSSHSVTTTSSAISAAKSTGAANIHGVSSSVGNLGLLGLLLTFLLR